MGKNKTKTVFRAYGDGTVIALFPQISGSKTGEICASYTLGGRRSLATVKLVLNRTRPAKPKEYKPLLSYLKKIGYNPLIAQRCTKKDFDIRRNNYGR